MDEIDRMDMPGFFRIRAWKASREAKQKGPRRRYIDEVLEEYAAWGVISRFHGTVPILHRPLV